MSEELKTNYCTGCKRNGFNYPTCEHNSKLKTFKIIYKESWAWEREVRAESEEKIQEMLDNEEIYFSMDDRRKYESETEVEEKW